MSLALLPTLGTAVIIGAVFYNCYYPGPIGLPANSAFTVPLAGRHALLYLVRHLRPVVVTDFGNDFTYVAEGNLKHLALRRPIPALDRDLIHVDIRTTTGDVETIAAYGKAHDYVLYRRQAFTEITFGIEVESFDSSQAHPGMFLEALDRLVLLYRVSTRDVRVMTTGRLSRDFPVIRETRLEYAGGRMPSTPYDRLVAVLPKQFSPIIFSFKEYEQFLPVFHHELREKAATIGHHLAVGTTVSDTQRALVDAFELLVAGGAPKFSLVEALSICEVMVFEFLSGVRRHLPSLDKRIRKEEGKYRLTLRKALTFLPEILAAAWPSLPDVLVDLNKTLNHRDKALHELEGVTQNDALDALNAVQQLLFAVEAHGASVG